MDPVSSKQSSALRCYYVAVSNYDAKMVIANTLYCVMNTVLPVLMPTMMQKTLVELLLALQTSSKLALAITCRCA